MEKEDTISVHWAQEDVETSYNVLNNNNRPLWSCSLNCVTEIILVTEGRMLVSPGLVLA
jgi:hypothetical protein